MIGERLDHIDNGRTLLADGAIDANKIVAFVVDHAVDSLEAGGHRLAHGLTIDHAGSDALHVDRLLAGDWSLVIDGLAQRIHYAPNYRVAHRHGHDAASAADLVAFSDLGVVAHEHCADLVFFKIHGDAGDVVRKLDELAGHDLV